MVLAGPGWAAERMLVTMTRGTRNLMIFTGGMLATNTYLRHQRHLRDQYQADQADRAAFAALTARTQRLLGALPPVPQVQEWPLAGTEWTPWTTEGVYVWDNVKDLDGVALCLDDPRRHWSLDAWMTFDRYQEQMQHSMVEYAYFANQVQETLSVLSYREYLSIIPKPYIDLDEPALAPRTGLDNAFVFNNERDPQGKSLSPGDPRRHWAPISFVIWQVYEKGLVYYEARAAKARQDDAHYTLVREESQRRNARTIYLVLFIIAVIVIGLIVAFCAIVSNVNSTQALVEVGHSVMRS